MANISGESLMQVDEPDYHGANPSTLPSPIGTPTQRQTRFAIPDKSFELMCCVLGQLVTTYEYDTHIQRFLSTVWMAVEEALSEDPEAIERLADKDEFKANVKDEGEKKVIELLRDAAKKGSWLDIIENSTYITPLTQSATLTTVFCV
jgi:hypothetical protein